jgi:hypothetical protein
MKLIKSSAIALAVSAMLVGPVLAQGASSDSKLRGSMQDKGSMQKGVTGSGDEEFNAQPGAGSERASSGTKAKGTVGSGAAKGSGGAAGDAATGSKRY